MATSATPPTTVIAAQGHLSATPSSPSQWLALARRLAAHSQPGEAERAFRQALALRPGWRDAELGLARLLIRNNHSGAGVRLLQSILDRNPEDSQAWLLAGEAFRRNYQPDHAQMAFIKALEADPNLESADYGLCNVQLEQGHLRAANERIERRFDTADSVSAAWWQMRARAAVALEGAEACQHVLQRALAQHPADADLHTMVARMAYLRGDSSWPDQWRQAVEDHPEQPELRLGLAAALRNGQHIDDARRVLEAGLSRATPLPSANPDNHQVQFLLELTDCELSDGNPSAAQEHAQRAALLSPPLAGLSRQLIDALLASGNAADALEVIRQARAVMPENPRYLAAQATALRALGDPVGDYLLDTDRLVYVKDMPAVCWQDLKDELTADLVHAHQVSGPPLDLSVRGGSQTLHSLLRSDSPAVTGLREYFLAAINEYQAQLRRVPDHPFDRLLGQQPFLTGCWSIRLTSGGFHVNHLHSEGVVSSAFYVSVPASVCSSPVGQCQHDGWLGFGEPRFSVPGVGVKRWVAPVPGRLVLFPSWFWHGTQPFTDPEPRLSVAFDARFR